MLEVADARRGGAARRPASACTSTSATGMKPGAKYYEWEARGVPLRLEIGPRDVAGGTVMLARRTGGPKEPLPLGGIWPTHRARRSDAMQHDLLDGRAGAARGATASARPKSKQEFIDFMEGDGGLRLRRLVRRPGGARPRSRSRPRPPSGCCPDAEFRSPEAPTTCIWTRPAGDGRGGVGEGVLSPAAAARRLAASEPALLLATPASSGAGVLLDAGVPLADDRRAVRHADVRLQRGRDPARSIAALDEALAGAAAPHLLRGQGERQPRACCACCATSAPAPTSSPAGELRRALAAGFARRTIVFSGVGKTDGRAARPRSRAGIGHVNVESLDELDGARRGSRTRTRRTVAGRHPGEPRRHAPTPIPTSAPGRAASSSACRSTRWWRRRGASRRTRASGSTTLAMHIGSQITDVGAVRRRARCGSRSWWTPCARPASTRSRCSTSAAGSASATATRQPLDPRAGPRRWRRLVRATGLALHARAGALPRGRAGRAAHAGALPQALRRQGVRDRGRRHERPRCGPATTRHTTRSCRWRRAPGRRCRSTWWARSARPATSSPSTATLRRARARATCSPSSAPGPTGS